jgi:hypothetical protein
MTPSGIEPIVFWLVILPAGIIVWMAVLVVFIMMVSILFGERPPKE